MILPGRTGLDDRLRTYYKGTLEYTRNTFSFTRKSCNIYKETLQYTRKSCNIQGNQSIYHETLGLGLDDSLRDVAG